MARAAKITTPFPSILDTARRLGVSKEDARILSEMAERSLESGEFVIPGVGRLVRVQRKARVEGKQKNGEYVAVPAKKVVKLRAARSAKKSLSSMKRK